ncbi:MAG: hypothetical protein K6T30_09535 [Alicyclobacillus sp.]|nr:hypothetical protein [Alicyclobacillus sp.]
MSRHIENRSTASARFARETVSISRKDLIAGWCAEAENEVREPIEQYTPADDDRAAYLSPAAQLLAELYLKTKEADFLQQPGKEVAQQ